MSKNAECTIASKHLRSQIGIHCNWTASIHNTKYVYSSGSISTLKTIMTFFWHLSRGFCTLMYVEKLFSAKLLDLRDTLTVTIQYWKSEPTFAQLTYMSTKRLHMFYGKFRLKIANKWMWNINYCFFNEYLSQKQGAKRWK